MTEYASLDDLTACGDGAEDLTLPSGKVVRVRGLSRFEWFLVGKKANDHDGDGGVAETLLLKMGLVAPELSETQADRWRKQPGAGPDVAAASNKIRALTGVGEGADKSNPGATGE